MQWFVLVLAGLCECGFTFCLGKAKVAEGTEHVLWLLGFGVFTLLSMCLLARATRSIPLGTAYPVWTGIGAAGTVLLGIFVFAEPVTFWRLLFISTLVASVVGLRLVG